MKKIVISIVSLIILYGVINLVFVGGQKLWHHDDEVKLEALKITLEDSENAINEAEEGLKKMENELTSLEDEINRYETDFPNGMPGEHYAFYSATIDNYNELLTTYKEKYATYSDQIDQYNTKVEEANAIAKKIGSTWYLTPIPRGK